MNNPKRHHFLSQFYQRGFIHPEKMIAVFHRKLGKYLYQQVDDTAVIGQFYTLVDEHGVQDKSIETHFAQIEGDARPVVDKLNDRGVINDAEKKALSLFLSSLYLRTPKHRYLAGEIHKVLLEKIFMRLHSGIDGLSENSLAITSIQELTPGAVEHKNMTLHQMMDLIPNIAERFCKMSWALVHPESELDFFITTDHPVWLSIDPALTSEHRGIGITTPGVVIMVPLSKNTFLAMQYFPGTPFLQHISASSKNVLESNIDTASRCYEYVYGIDMDLIKNVVVQSKVDVVPWVSSVRTN